MSKTGMMTRADVAAELRIDPLAVDRLVARGRLAFVTIGDGTPRFDSSVVGAYVRSGAPDLAMPPVSGRWFDELRAGQGFEQAVIDAAQVSVPKTPPRTPSGKILTRVTYRPNAKIRNVFNRPMRAERATTYREAYLVWRLRWWTKSAMRRPNGRRTVDVRREIVRLYDSPTAYETAIRAGLSALMEKRIEFTHTYSTPKPEGGFRVDPVQFVLPMSEVLTSPMIQRVLDIAF